MGWFRRRREPPPVPRLLRDEPRASGPEPSGDEPDRSGNDDHDHHCGGGPAEWRALIDRFGWMVMSIEAGDDDERPFSFTVGLTERGLPEVIVYGLDPALAHALLNNLAGRLAAGQTFGDGEVIPELVDGDYRVSLYDVERLQDPLGAAFELYGKDRVRVRQLVLPDRNDVLPWEPGYRLGDLQPVLFTPPDSGAPASHGAGHDVRDWALDVDPHLGVFVSNFTSSGDRPVLVVEHTDDGDWAFLDGVFEVQADNVHMECLHHVLDRDASLVDVVRTLNPGTVRSATSPVASGASMRPTTTSDLHGPSHRVPYRSCAVSSALAHFVTSSTRRSS